MKKSPPYMDLICFSILSPIAFFLISSNWLFPLIGLVISSICSFGVYRIRDDNFREERIQNASRKFLLAYFDSFNESNDSEEAFRSSSHFLKEAQIDKSYQQVKENPYITESWPLGVYREAFVNSINGKRLSLMFNYPSSETDKNIIKIYYKEKEILFTSLSVLIMIAIIKVIYGARLFQNQDLCFLILLDLMCVVPNGSILLYEYLKRRK